jgi:hypothetical protein
VTSEAADRQAKFKLNGMRDLVAQFPHLVVVVHAAVDGK